MWPTRGDVLIMPTAKNLTYAGGFAFAICIALGGCSKLKQNDPEDASKLRAQTKRQQAACGSAAAYSSLKGVLFDRAVRQRTGDRSALDTLADYSFIRMENPVVAGWDQGLDVTRCKGSMILEIPAGARQAFGGEQHLRADIDYTAQAAADGSGYVYQMTGAAPIVTQLASFNLNSGAYRPSPAIDERQAGVQKSAAALPAGNGPVPIGPSPSAPAVLGAPMPAHRQVAPTDRNSGQLAATQADTESSAAQGGEGEATVRAFYSALGTGNGALASAQIVPEKRQSRAFSPDAISTYYGRLPEPLRLTGIEPVSGGVYRVSYRYSSGRSRCNGSAVVNLTNRDGRNLIRSIRALNGC